MKDNCHQCRIIRFPKISILKNPFGSSVEHDVADKLYIYIYIHTHTHMCVCVCVCVCVCDVSGLTVADLKYFSLCYLASF